MPSELEAIRQQLDAVDDALVRLLARRASLVSQAWTVKRQIGLPLSDLARETNVRERLIQLGVGLGLSRTRLEGVLQRIVGIDLLS